MGPCQGTQEVVPEILRHCFQDCQQQGADHHLRPKNKHRGALFEDPFVWTSSLPYGFRGPRNGWVVGPCSNSPSG